MNPVCHCGRPLHYHSADIRAFVEQLVKDYGETVRVTVEGRTWLVPRHYMALHGIAAKDLPNLGFKEVTTDTAR